MSGFSNSLVDDISFLYSNISQKNTEILNEDSQYYDEEVAELVEDILSKISLSMIYEGYSANATISFLANSSEDDILNEYLNFDENLIKESVVSEDYIQEQLELFVFAINEGLFDKLGIGALKFLGRVASKPARMKAADRLLKSSDPVRTAAAYQKLANKNVTKAGFKATSTDGAPASLRFKNTNDAARTAAIMKPIAKVKEIAKSAKAALTSPTAKKVGLGALGLGAAVGAGYIGGKMSNDGSAKVGPKIVGPKIVGPKIVGPKSPSSSGDGGGGSNSSGDGGGGSNSSSGGENSPSQNRTPKKQESTPPTKPPYIGKTPGGTEYEIRTPTSKELEAAQDTRASGGSEEEAIKAGVDAGKTSNPVKMDIPGFALGGKMPEFGVDKTGIKPLTPEKKKPPTETTSEGYDAYDLVLEYLLSQGHTETIEEAHYVMMEMDEEMIGSIVDEYKNDLLSEEITEWVNELVKDGYDLSEYTWDDLAEYYVNEAKVDTVVDKTLEDAGVSDSIRMSVKKASRTNRKTSNNRMTRTQSRLANKLSNIAGRRQDYEGEISGTNRGPESPTDR